MIGLLAACVTVLAWGTWLAPSQNVPLRHQQIRTFYVAATNLVLAGFVSLLHGAADFSAGQFSVPFLGGLVWAVSGVCAFTATANLGIAKAFGIWAPLNIVVGLIAGRLVFGEFSKPTAVQLFVLVLSVAVIVGGVGLIVAAKNDEAKERSTKRLAAGLLGALGAGVLWGVYFVPVKFSGVSPWVGALPLAAGMFVGSALLVLLTREAPRLTKAGDYGRVIATGVLWAIGIFGMLVLVDEWGAGSRSRNSPSW